MKITKVALFGAAFSCLLVACGGGNSPGDPEVLLQSHPIASNTSPLAIVAMPTPRQAAAVRTPDATSLFNWAELTYPALFEAPKSNQTFDVWTYRYYPKTDIYLGVNTSGDVLGLVGKGGTTYDSVPLGKVAAFGCSVYPSDCAVTSKYSAVNSYATTECVKDNSTGLTWEGKPTSGLRTSTAKYTNWGDNRAGDVSAYAAAVNATALCGFTDWRLPTIDELKSLVNKTAGSPAIDSTWFPNTQKYAYWSSTVYFDTYIWVVLYLDGWVFSTNPNDPLHVRLVR